MHASNQYSKRLAGLTLGLLASSALSIYLVLFPQDFHARSADLLRLAAVVLAQFDLFYAWCIYAAVIVTATFAVKLRNAYVDHRAARTWEIYFANKTRRAAGMTTLPVPDTYAEDVHKLEMEHGAT